MEPTIIGIKKLHQELPRIATATERGQSFLVVRHAKPIFRIDPVRNLKPKRYTFADIKKLQFKLPRRQPLSRQIDKIVYGV